MISKYISRTNSIPSINIISLLIIIQCALFIAEGGLSLSYREAIGTIQFSIDLIFMVELIYRINKQGVTFFKSPLNLFDFTLVLVSVILFSVSNGTASTITMLRVFRLIRLFKIVALFPDVDKTLSGITRALKASRAIFLMLSALIVFFSILGYLLFGALLPEHFADPIISAYTVFSLFTIEGWNELPSLVPSSSGYYYLIRIYVISVIVFGSFFALSLANAIFIDEMVIDNNENLEDKIDELSSKIEKQSEQIEKLTTLVNKLSHDNKNTN